MKHTPGPYRLDDNSIMAMFENEEVQIAVMAHTSRSHPDGGWTSRLREENKHNAYLFIAAPDLLQVVEAVEWVGDEPYCPWCGGDWPQHDSECIHQAALIKARGQ